MNVIHKHILRSVPHTKLELPKGAIPLQIDWQRGEVAMWVLTDTEQRELEERTFHINPTGQGVRGSSYIGSAISDAFCFHVFEEKNPAS